MEPKNIRPETHSTIGRGQDFWEGVTGRPWYYTSSFSVLAYKNQLDRKTFIAVLIYLYLVASSHPAEV